MQQRWGRSPWQRSAASAGTAAPGSACPTGAPAFEAVHPQCTADVHQAGCQRWSAPSRLPALSCPGRAAQPQPAGAPVSKALRLRQAAGPPSVQAHVLASRQARVGSAVMGSTPKNVQGPDRDAALAGGVVQAGCAVRPHTRHSAGGRPCCLACLPGLSALEHSSLMQAGRVTPPTLHPSAPWVLQQAT